MTITVTVTQDHIDKGTPCKSASCPVALALRDAFPNEYMISVCGEEATLTGLDGVRTIALPEVQRETSSQILT